MIQEIATDLDVKPDAIFCSVGGAGLLAGVMVGCETVGWEDGRYMSKALLVTFPDLSNCGMQCQLWLSRH